MKYMITCKCGAQYAESVPLTQVTAAHERALNAGWSTDDVGRIVCPKHKGETSVKIPANKQQADAAKAAAADGLPEEFVRVAETPAGKAKREASAKKNSAKVAAAEAAKQAERKAEAERMKKAQAEKKALKAKNRKATKQAQAEGETTAMPLEGAAAAKAIKKAARKAAQEPASAPKAAKAKVAKAKAAKPTNGHAKANGGASKSDIAERLLLRPNGASQAELAEATGWKWTNLKVAADRAGKSVQEISPGRYHLA